MDETAVGQHAGVMSHLIITQYDKLRLCCSSLTFIFSGWGIETQMDEDWIRGGWIWRFQSDSVPSVPVSASQASQPRQSRSSSPQTAPGRTTMRASLRGTTG